jgi:sulfate transport system permease protein
VADVSRTRSAGTVLGEPAPVRRALIGVALAFLFAFLVLPLALVFSMAFSKGIPAYFAAITEPASTAAIRLTLATAIAAVPLNLAFGLGAAWLVARFRFRGRSALVTLIDLPYSVSPVISGMVFVLLFGANGFFGPFLQERDIKIIFAYPGILLATIFVTSPIIARELIPVLEAQGAREEEAALTLGAKPWTMFFRITLPKLRWGLLYGLVLCNARAMGEFGAVSVVSGHVRGRTTTMPLHVEMLYNEYDFAAAFAVSSLLAMLALATLVVKSAIERREPGA